MKKAIIVVGVIIVVSATLFGGLGFAEDAVINLQDIQNHWSEQNVVKMVDLQIVGGYPDGTFKPDATISVSEFVKIIVAYAYDGEIAPVEGSPWYEAYVNKGLELDYFEVGEFDSYTRPITREEAARLTAKVGIDLNKLVLSDDELSFTDKSDIESENMPYIATVVEGEIITGYPDGTFKPEGTATRAEVCTIVARLILKDEVEVAEPVVVEEPVAEVETPRLDPVYEDFLDWMLELDRRYVNGESLPEDWDKYDKNVCPVGCDLEKTTFEFSTISDETNKSAFNAYGHLVPCALEHDLYAYCRYGSVFLFATDSDVRNQNEPFFRIIHYDPATTLDGLGEYYASVDLYRLHNIRRQEGETLKEARARTVAANFREDYLVEEFERLLVDVIKESDVEGVADVMYTLHDRYREVDVQHSIVEQHEVNGTTYTFTVYGSGVKVYLENPYDL